jgi:hypothetical protein
VIIELRQYTVHPGQRDVLADIFMRHFIHGQEAMGMRVLGQFYDLDDLDRFVWLRGFPDMAARKASLIRFYEQSEVWRTYGPAANATMIDSSDVLLLRGDGRLPADSWLAVTFQSVQGGVSFEAEPAENDYPRLPVRTDGPPAVWFKGFHTRQELMECPQWSIRLAAVPDPAPQRQQVPEEDEPGQRASRDPRAHVGAQYHGQDQQQR